MNGNNTEIETGRPTLAGRIPKGSEQQFKPAALHEAEFGRLPKAGERCPVSALSRSGLIDLGREVPELLVRVRKPGAVRGAVLVSYPVLREHLRKLQAEAAGKGVAE